MGMGLVGLAAGVTPVRGACSYASDVCSRRPLAALAVYVTDSEKNSLGGVFNFCILVLYPGLADVVLLRPQIASRFHNVEHWIDATGRNWIWFSSFERSVVSGYRK